MSDNKVVSMETREERERKEHRKQREANIEDMKINVFVKMEELREVCKAAGKPILLSSFLSELSQIAVTWWCLDKENEGGRHNGR